MKKLNSIILSLFLSTTTWAECKISPVVLDTSNSSPTPSATTLVNNTGQKITTQLTANTDIFGMYISNGTIPVPSSSKFAFEYVIKRPVNLNANELVSGFFAGTSENEGLVVSAPSVGRLQTQGATSLLAVTPSSEITPNSSLMEASSATDLRIGIYYNQITKKIGMIVNGIDRGDQWNYTTPLIALKFLIGVEIRRLADTNTYPIGEQVYYEIVTDHSKMQLNYPIGTTDICGNTI